MRISKNKYIKEVGKEMKDNLTFEDFKDKYQKQRHKIVSDGEDLAFVIYEIQKGNNGKLNKKNKNLIKWLKSCMNPKQDMSSFDGLVSAIVEEVYHCEYLLNKGDDK